MRPVAAAAVGAGKTLENTRLFRIRDAGPMVYDRYAQAGACLCPRPALAPAAARAARPACRAGRTRTRWRAARQTAAPAARRRRARRAAARRAGPASACGRARARPAQSGRTVRSETCPAAARPVRRAAPRRRRPPGSAGRRSGGSGGRFRLRRCAAAAARGPQTAGSCAACRLALSTASGLRSSCPAAAMNSRCCRHACAVGRSARLTIQRQSTASTAAPAAHSPAYCHAMARRWACSCVSSRRMYTVTTPRPCGSTSAVPV